MNLSEELLKMHEFEEKTKHTKKFYEHKSANSLERISSSIEINEKKRLKIEDVSKIRSESKRLINELGDFTRAIKDGGFEELAPDITKLSYDLFDKMFSFNDKLTEKITTYVKGQIRKAGLKKGGSIGGNKLDKFSGVKSDGDGGYYYSADMVVNGHAVNVQPVTNGKVWALVSKDDKQTTYGNGEEVVFYNYGKQDYFFSPDEMLKVLMKKSKYLNGTY